MRKNLERALRSELKKLTVYRNREARVGEDTTYLDVEIARIDGILREMMIEKIGNLFEKLTGNSRHINTPRIKYDKRDKKHRELWRGIMGSKKEGGLQQLIYSEYYMLRNNFNRKAPYLIESLENLDALYRGLKQINLLQNLSLNYHEDYANKLTQTTEGIVEIYSMYLQAYNEAKIVRFKDGHKTHNNEYKIKQIHEDLYLVTILTSGIEVCTLLCEHGVGLLRADLESTTGERVHLHPQRTYLINGDKPGIPFHRIIVQDEIEEKYRELGLDLSAKRVIDVHHINENKLDNRRKNLIVVTRAEHGFLNTAYGREFNDYLKFREVSNSTSLNFNEEMAAFKDGGVYERYKAVRRR